MKFISTQYVFDICAGVTPSLWVARTITTGAAAAREQQQQQWQQKQNVVRRVCLLTTLCTRQMSRGSLHFPHFECFFGALHGTKRLAEKTTIRDGFPVPSFFREATSRPVPFHLFEGCPFRSGIFPSFPSRLAIPLAMRLFFVPSSRFRFLGGRGTFPSRPDPVLASTCPVSPSRGVGGCCLSYSTGHTAPSPRNVPSVKRGIPSNLKED